MHQNTELYRIFLAVARCGSFSAAAREEYISQPAVSQAIRTLEGSLGVRLFQRGAKGALLTAEGRVLYDYVQAGMELISSGEKRLNAMRSLETGELSIGAGDTLTRHFLLPYLEEFHTRYPGVSVRVRNRTSSVLVQALHTGRIDLAFVNLPLPDEEGLAILPLRSIRDGFVAGERYAHLAQSPCGWSTIAAHPLVMLEPKSISRQYVQAQFAAKGIALQPDMELGAYELLPEFARIGLGIACIIEDYTPPGEGLYRIEADPPLPPRQVAACHLSAIPLSTAARQLLEMIEEGGGAA